MAIQKTLAAKAKKQPKTKRSLRKKSFAGTPVSEQKDLAINLDKDQLDNIFKNLYLGNLQNPQMALGLVYSLALDALEKTLVQGIDEIIHAIPGQNESSNNPFAPYLNQVLPRNPEKISSFQASIADKIQAAKKSLQERIQKTYEADAKGNNLIGKKVQFSSEAIRAFLNPKEDNGDVPAVNSHLSQERLHELFAQIQVPLPDDGIKRFHITQTPNHYRFSFGNQPIIKKQTDSVQISSDGRAVIDNEESIEESIEESVEEIAEDAESADEIEFVEETCEMVDVEDVSETLESSDDIDSSVIQSEEEITSVVSDNHVADDSAIRLTPDMLKQTLGITAEQTDSLKSGALDVMTMAVEVSEAMKEIAVQIAQATMEAFEEERFVPTLTEALQNDPRMQDDSELSEFVELLEAGDDAAAQDSEDIDNDELANAFGMLLDKLDL